MQQPRTGVSLQQDALGRLGVQLRVLLGVLEELRGRRKVVGREGEVEVGMEAKEDKKRITVTTCAPSLLGLPCLSTLTTAQEQKARTKTGGD